MIAFYVTAVTLAAILATLFVSVLTWRPRARRRLRKRIYRNLVEIKRLRDQVRDDERDCRILGGQPFVGDVVQLDGEITVGRKLDDAIEALGNVWDLIEAGEHKAALEEIERTLDELEHNNLDVPDIYEENVA